MSDLGITLAWLAVQVSLVLAPGMVLYSLAARRGPAAGSSVATLCLGLVVALTVAAFLPGIGRGPRTQPGRPDVMLSSIAPVVRGGGTMATGRDAPIGPSAAKRPFADWRVAWARIERGAAEPAARCRPWAGTLAGLILTGTAAGLLRLAVGLGAVVACRRRGRPVDDPGMFGLLDELRGAIGCRAAVELREVTDLVGPAMAGWRRPVILLPEDWRSWDDSERRAVLAHELAHVVRGDYAAGLLARLALAFYGYHPMARWMAGQLRLQQELAADAIGARHAGGRAGYLVALSRLALRQDGRSPCWPARAFLPARGTLIRRITMLRDETRIGMMDRPWSRARRLAMTASLVGVTAVVMALRGPARGGEDGIPAAAERKAEAPTTRVADSPLAPLYVPEGMHGVVAIRPAAAARHVGVDRLKPLLDETLGFDFSDLAKELGVDMARPGFVRLSIPDLEWITLGVRFGRSKNPKGPEMHTIEFGSPVFRTVAPFDWLAFLRQWGFEFAEVREGGSVYHRITGKLMPLLGPGVYCVYLPDERTIVFDEEKVIRKLAAGEAPPRPAYLRGPEWERASRGVLAYAISNKDGALAKDYDLGRPDDAMVLPLLKGVDHWTFSVDDADAMVVRASAACDGGDASAAISHFIDAYVKEGLDALDHLGPQAQSAESRDRILRLARSLLSNIRVDHTDRSVCVQTGGSGTLAEVASVIGAAIQAEADEVKARSRAKGSKP
jgi:hypothetical protein